MCTGHTYIEHMVAKQRYAGISSDSVYVQVHLEARILAPTLSARSRALEGWGLASGVPFSSFASRVSNLYWSSGYRVERM